MITATGLDTFHQQGFLKIPGLIPVSLMKKLHQLFDKLMIPDVPIEKVIHENKGKKYVTNLENICYKGNLAALELLGFPPILEMAQAICGNDFFLIQEFAVIKNLGDELPVLWHQDMLHHRTGNCFTMGIYLDDANENDGALRVVPKSHLMGKPICELSKEPFIEAPMKAGDILIHDMMLAHYSEPLNKNALRRVLYFEFLSAAHVLNENIYAKELVDRRTRLLFAAARRYRALHPGEKQFALPMANPSPDDDTKSMEAVLTEIYSQAINARPSAYCFENINIFSSF
jgi:hypothetical protein